MKQNFLALLTLLIILISGLLFRLYGNNWDQGQHLHPDERFLTMVMGGMELPQKSSEYFDADISKLNPINIGNPFYVYGIFPLVINKVIAVWLGNDSYELLTLQGRMISGIVDAVVIIGLFVFGYMVRQKYGLKKNVGMFASSCYALFVLPIQLSHFFATDTFANTFLFLSVVSVFAYSYRKFPIGPSIAGVFLGLAIASKINVVVGIPLILMFIGEKVVFEKNSFKISLKKMLLATLQLTGFLVFSYLSVRLFDPFYFADSFILNPTLHPKFLENIQALKNLSDPNGYFPPSIQWMSATPIIFPLINLIVFGIGIPFSIVMVAGIILIPLYWYKKRIQRLSLLGLLIWCIALFVFQGVQFVKAMRYLLVLYPYIALFCGIALAEGAHYLVKQNAWIKFSVVFPLLLIFLIWPVAFMSIYVGQHSRVVASYWMNTHVPDGSFIASEHWDDGLPLGVELPEDVERRVYKSRELPVFGPDESPKWNEMESILMESEFYIMSSNRAWGSIGKVPERYPRMAMFYDEMFSGTSEFVKVVEFTSYPSLRYLGIPVDFPDDWSEEAFTVYDHPKVMIFKKIREDDKLE